jgi:hypothetical protein
VFRKGDKNKDRRYLEWYDKAEKVFDDPVKQYTFLKNNDLSARYLLIFLSEAAQKQLLNASPADPVDPDRTAQLLACLSETIQHARHDLPESVYASILERMEESLLSFIRDKTESP